MISSFYVSGQGFTTDNINGRLLDANGNEFIMKGMNVPTSWFTNDVNSNISNVRNNTGSNCLRIVVNTSNNDNQWQTTVQNCIDNDIIPMVELHDVTGSTNANDLNSMAQFWASKASYLTRQDISPYILINIANEWGTWQTGTDDANNNNGGAWLDAFTTAIQTVRNAGIKTTLVIDAVGYGQDRFEAQNIRDDAKTMMARDASFLNAEANLLFSIHMYCEWSQGGDDPAIVGTIKNSGIPIMVGEFGYQHATDGSCDIDEQYIMDVCQNAGVGWLAWSQKGNGGGVEYLDLCNDWACTSLSTWGNTVFNGRNGTNTSVTASVFTSTTSLPVATILSPENNKSICEGAAITITASASISEGSISKVDFYDGDTFLGTDNSSPYTYEWSKPSSGGHVIRAIATSDLDLSSIPATSMLNVDALPVLAAYSNINNSTWEEQSNIELCEGGEVQFGPHPYDVEMGWSWVGPNDFTANTREISLLSLTSDQSGEYTATHLDPTTGCSSSIGINVTVEGTPSLIITAPTNNSIIATTTGGADVELTVDATGTEIVGVDYYNGSTFIGSSNTEPFSYLWQAVDQGVYSDIVAIATSQLGCEGESEPISFEVDMVTSLKGSKGEFEIYPNPASSFLSINGSFEGEWIIFDVFGNKPLEGSDKQIDITSLASGIYQLKVEGNTFKFIKE